MGVERRWVRGRDMRNFVGGIERVGRGDYLHGSGECADACDCDVDGSVGNGFEQDCSYNDHGDSSSTCGRGGESDDSLGADGIDAECNSYGNERPAE